ncbi:MAG: cyclic-di-AMP receptor [Thermomicrobiales bacterium]
MRLVIAVVDSSDIERLLRVLGNRGHRATTIDVDGGFLRQGNVTLFVGVQETFVGEVLDLIGDACRTRVRVFDPVPPLAEPSGHFASRPLEEHSGGASVFVLPVERYERFS